MYAYLRPWGNHIEGGQTVSAYPNFTPIILKPKTPSRNLLPLPRACHGRRRRRRKGIRLCVTCLVHQQISREKEGIWQIARRRALVRHDFSSRRRKREQGGRWRRVLGYFSTRSNGTRIRERKKSSTVFSNRRLFQNDCFWSVIQEN